jgi:hypothetical protein
MDPVGRTAGAVLARAGAEVDGAGCGSARCGSATRASREHRGSWWRRRARVQQQEEEEQLHGVQDDGV